MSLNTLILTIVKEKHPKTVKQLMHLAQEKSSFSKEEIMNAIIELNNTGKLSFNNLKINSKPKGYNFLLQTMWYWVTLVLVVAASLSINISETSYPLVYVRYILGSIFVLFFPGFTIVKVIFPTKKTNPLERVAQSVGLSLSFVPVIGLLLNFTEYGITTTSVTVSLLILTVIFATSGVIRGYYNRKKI